MGTISQNFHERAFAAGPPADDRAMIRTPEPTREKFAPAGSSEVEDCRDLAVLRMCPNPCFVMALVDGEKVPVHVGTTRDMHAGTHLQRCKKIGGKWIYQRSVK